MTINDTTMRHKKRQAETSDAAVPTGGPSPLLEQAQAWADIARAAHDNCVQGDEAERALNQRRNESGQ